MKYEEDVDYGAGRWSKPHVATLSLHSLFELKRLLHTGTVQLDMDADNLWTIAGKKYLLILADLFLEIAYLLIIYVSLLFTDTTCLL